MVRRSEESVKRVLRKFFLKLWRKHHKSVKEATRKCHRNFKEEFDKRSVNVVLSN